MDRIAASLNLTIKKAREALDEEEQEAKELNELQETYQVSENEESPDCLKTTRDSTRSTGGATGRDPVIKLGPGIASYFGAL